MPTKKKRSYDEELADTLQLFYADPLGHVMFSYPWQTDPSIQIVSWDTPEFAPYRERFPGYEFGPDLWACEFLDDVAAEVTDRKFDGRTAVDPIKFSTASGHGIGKTTLTAWLIKWILDTRPFSKGTVTAGTIDQLRTKTWAELAKWHNLSLTKHWFIYNSGRGSMFLAHREYKEQWRCDAQTCKEENSEAFAGQHAVNSTSFYIFDEASIIPDIIYEVREGGTTDGEPMIFDFGNPTRNSGMFFENCVGRFRHRYKVRSIDSRNVTITNKKKHQDWIDDYGIESDYVKVRVLGVFPSMGATQFISSQDVETAQNREIVEDKYAPLLIGVDVARFGSDESVILSRIGDDCRSFPAKRFRGLDTVALVGQVIEVIREFRTLGRDVNGLFIDGGGIGGGVVDQLRALRYSPIEVQFGGGAIDKQTYRFRGDELWGRMRDGIKTRLVLPKRNEPNGADLYRDLTQREFGYTKLGHKIHLESKDDMKARLGQDASPDIADALALTFAQEIASAVALDGSLVNKAVEVKHDYDPLNPSF